MQDPTQNKVRRLPQRASYERADLDAVLAEGKLCHVGIDDGGPVVIPMAYAPDDDRILLHGSTNSRLLHLLADGAAACITVTHLDGLVLAKSIFHHSMNYRSAVAFGKGEAIREPTDKERALRVLSEHLAPGRWELARPPTKAENEATLVIAVPIDSFSVKSRSGPPGDKPEDVQLEVWAGVIERRDVWVDPRDPAG